MVRQVTTHTPPVAGPRPGMGGSVRLMGRTSCEAPSHGRRHSWPRRPSMACPLDARLRTGQPTTEMPPAGTSGSKMGRRKPSRRSYG